MKSITYPYVYEHRDDIYIMRDGVGQKPRRAPRKSEVVAYNLSPDVVLERISGASLGRHFISHMHSGTDGDLEATKEQYKAKGYRYLLSEAMFWHESNEVPHYSCDPPVRRVLSITDSQAISKQRRNKKAIRDADLLSDSPQHRLYAVIDGADAFGWVGSVPFETTSWIADLYVLEKHRGKGYGRALMSAVTSEDRRNGIHTSVLLASAAGARLYPHNGYTQIGTLQLFCPKKNSPRVD
jgi:hypothetical protein